MGCVAVFTLSSVLCALSTSLADDLLARVIQGIGGGGMAPTEAVDLRRTLPARERAQGLRAVWPDGW